MKHRTTFLFISLITATFIYTGMFSTAATVSARPPAPEEPTQPPIPPLNPQGRDCTVVRIGSDDEQALKTTNPDTISPIPQATGGDIPESTSIAQKDDPSIVADSQGNLYAIWVNNHNYSINIYFARSTEVSDDGMTWSDNVKVNDTPLPQSLSSNTNQLTELAETEDTVSSADLYAAPSLTIDEQGNLYAVWVDTRNGNPDIYFSRSTDQGRSWSTNRKVNSDTGMHGQYDPTIAVTNAPGSGTTQPVIYVAWEDHRFSYPTIVMSRSDNGGSTWNENVVVSPPNGSAENPQIVVDSTGTIYCVWCHEFIEGIEPHSTHKQATDEEEIPEEEDRGDEGGPPEEDLGHDIYFARSDTLGTTWSDPVTINNGTTGSAETPSIVLDSLNNLYVVWHDSRNGNSDIYMARSTDGGYNWFDNVRINDDTGSANQLIPSITVDISGTLYVAWEDYRNRHADIYVATSSDGGASWSSNTKLNDDTGEAGQAYPILISDTHNTIYAAWRDTRDGNPDIYFAKSTDKGERWTANGSVDTKGGVGVEGFRILLPMITRGSIAETNDADNDLVVSLMHDNE